MRKKPQRGTTGYVVNVVFTGTREEGEELLRQARRRILEALASKLAKEREAKKC